jgi:hypothetical protein
MLRTLLGGTAVVVALTAGLAACDRNKDVAQTTTTTTDTQLAQAETAAPAPMIAGEPRVPVMTPTGDDAQAVKPGMPSQNSKGTAPMMQPTGETMPYYTPQTATR